MQVKYYIFCNTCNYFDATIKQGSNWSYLIDYISSTHTKELDINLYKI